MNKTVCVTLTCLLVFNSVAKASEIMESGEAVISKYRYLLRDADSDVDARVLCVIEAKSHAKLAIERVGASADIQSPEVLSVVSGMENGKGYVECLVKVRKYGRVTQTVIEPTTLSAETQVPLRNQKSQNQETLQERPLSFSYIGILGGISAYGDARKAALDTVLPAVGNANPGMTISGYVEPTPLANVGKIVVGSWHTPNIATEAGYANFTPSSFSVITTGVATKTTFELSGNAIYFAALIGTQSSYFKVGGYTGNSKVGAVIQGPGGSASIESNSTNSGLMYGYGMDFLILQTLVARLELERYTRFGDRLKTWENDLTQGSLGILVKF